MHLSVVGAGVLGRIYGVRAAAAMVSTSRPRVTFVTRPARLRDTAAFAIEQINGAHAKHTIDAPDRVATVPADATAVLVAVRFEEVQGLDQDLVALLRAAPASAPLLVVTPLLPSVRGQLEGAIGRRVVPSMPGAVGYLDDRGVVRYWLPKVVATLFEEETPLRHAVEDVARALTDAGVPSRLERGVEALGGHEGELDAPAAGFSEGAELGGADFDEGEFGGDEEAVGSDETEDDQGLKRDAEEGIH